ncbi:hypothetical protein SO802_016798 [Lithocarpus litseifolius]|uniref:Uncharacterized protein n=1 Tax=Lithocarpus litseifolius TaxID=425828 RepID=A0AAW2CZL9_9ROSI
MAPSKVSLKLFIDKRSNRVLFAEAGKKFIDFLFNILFQPIGTLIPLLKQEIMVGSLGNVQDSIINLSPAYLDSNERNCRLELLQFSNILSSNDREFYLCDCRDYFSDIYNRKCPRCPSYIRSDLKYCPLNGVKEGPYLVMNDLEVKPLSTISVTTLLNKFHLKEDRDLEEKVVDLGMVEGLKLLRTSLQSKNALTDIFSPRVETESLDEVLL